MNWHESIEGELNEIVSEDSLFRHFRNRRITILGGSGFIGKWLLSCLIHANDNLNSNIDISVVSKEPAKLSMAYGEKFKIFETLSLDFNEIPDELDLPESDYFLHAATSANPEVHSNPMNEIMLTAQRSSRVIINSAIKYGNVPKVVHLSSGAVYPRQDSLELALLEMDVLPNQSDTPSYRNAKLLIENLMSNASRAGLIQAANPRLFAFSGPGLPLDTHFAIGNFLNDALEGRRIRINGNPRTRRSYMYPTDLMRWLFTILVSPVDVPTNVGNSSSLSLEDLARAILLLTNGKGIELSESGAPPDSYFPSTKNSEMHYGVQISVDLESGLRRWINYITNQK
jgi:dTDP-glucose 4,6-dehydratase